MAITAGRFYMRVIHDHMSYPGMTPRFTSRIAVSRHSSSCEKQLSKALDVAFYSAQISIKCYDIRASVRSSLLSSADDLARTLVWRSSFSNEGQPWAPRRRNVCRLGIARSFFSSSSADKTGIASPAAKEGDSQITSSVDGPTAPKGEIQDSFKEILSKVNNSIDSVKERTTSTLSWAREKKESMSSMITEQLDPPEYMLQTITQLTYSTFAAVLAWLVMPRLFRRLHKYFEAGPTRLLKRAPTEAVPYELSFWSALEDPARILITFVVFTQVGALVAPSTVASQYLDQAWKGGAVVAVVWFLYRWKTNFLSRVLAHDSIAKGDRERYLAIDKYSSVMLLILGAMTVAETCGIAVQSVLTVGGIGGVATAFAARDILGNLLSGVALQFSKPFSIGDTIKAGSIEGQVLDIGLTSTRLLDSEKFPVAVPNSFFSSQVIVNKSRAPLHAFTGKIPVHLKDFEKIPLITQEIQQMLKSHPKVPGNNGTPHCYVSRVGNLSMDISIYCSLKRMPREELMATEQGIILEGIKIIAQAGATVGAPDG